MEIRRFRGNEFGFVGGAQVPVRDGWPKGSRETIEHCADRLAHVRFHGCVGRSQSVSVHFAVTNDSQETEGSSYGMQDVGEVTFQEAKTVLHVENVVFSSFLNR